MRFRVPDTTLNRSHSPKVHSCQDFNLWLAENRNSTTRSSHEKTILDANIQIKRNKETHNFEIGNSRSFEKTAP